MEKELIKLFIKLLYEIREDVPSILSGIDYEKGDRGIVSIKEDTVNVSMRKTIIEASKGKLEDYKVSFKDNKINIEATVKVVLKTKVNIDVRVLNFVFNKNEHKAVLSYETNGLSAANAFIPQIILGFSKNYPEYISLEGNHITLELKDASMVPDFLVARYLGTSSGALKMAFLVA